MVFLTKLQKLPRVFDEAIVEFELDVIAFLTISS